MIIRGYENKALKQIAEENKLNKNDIEWLEKVVSMALTIRKNMRLRKLHEKEVEND